jgi:hypothetical protein
MESPGAVGGCLETDGQCKRIRALQGPGGEEDASLTAEGLARGRAGWTL